MSDDEREAINPRQRRQADRPIWVLGPAWMPMRVLLLDTCMPDPNDVSPGARTRESAQTEDEG
jgi:hypothetical protein